MLFAPRMLRKGQRVVVAESLSDVTHQCSLPPFVHQVPYRHLFYKMGRARPRGAHYCPPHSCSGRCQRRDLNSDLGIPKSVLSKGNPDSEPQEAGWSSPPLSSVLREHCCESLPLTHVMFVCAFSCWESAFPPFPPSPLLVLALQGCGLHLRTSPK